MDYIMIGPYQFDRDASKDDMRLDYCSSFQEVALDESSLSFDTVSVEVCTTTIGAQLSALPNNTPIIVYRGGEIKARFVSSGVSRIGPVTYQLTGRSPMGALTGMVHTGGIYTGQTVEDVVKEICGNIPSLIKSVYAGVKLYGWLPYADGKERSARDNLAQVLFAIGAYLRTDLNGVLRIEPLWDGTASLIDVDRSYTGGTVKYDSPISAVTVTEHQYVAGTEVKELFSGTAQNGDIITFSEPMHSLSATGFTILESGANYAKISAGTGALTGKAYIHNTRLITQPVTAGAVENIKSVTDATLVSLVNSYAVAKRLADYYRCRETITNDIVSGHEKPGHVVSVYHPYDKKMVSACIQSLDTTMSATLKSSMEALVGFTPAQPEAAEYLDERVVLTGSGEFNIPEGTTTIHYVMISAGQGGRCGEKGEDTQSGPKFSWTNPVFEDRVDGYALALGGKGGPGGKGGMGGRIVEGDLDVSQLKSLAYACGKSGKGAEFSPDDLPGTDGTDTLFHGMTTAGASAPDFGFTDPITGEQFGGIGEDGLPGGNGAGRDPAVSEYTDDSVQKYVNGTIAYDEDGNAFTPGPVAGSEGKVSMTRIASTGTPRSYGWYSSGLGGGPAAGANGKAGSSGRGLPGETTVDVTGGSGADGMTATLTPSKPKRYGRGGRGGYGGGGAGSGGIAVKNGNGTITPGTPGSGGLGGPGGPSADGCVILYYRKFGQAKAGPLVQKGGGLFFDRLNKLFIV
jgi:hypothetical protein|nr:MAG TPA: hypothetical protein [Caudoviricetes sp.]